jgi:hypothetical protein
MRATSKHNPGALRRDSRLLMAGRMHWATSFARAQRTESTESAIGDLKGMAIYLLGAQELSDGIQIRSPTVGHTFHKFGIATSPLRKSCSSCNTEASASNAHPLSARKLWPRLGRTLTVSKRVDLTQAVAFVDADFPHRSWPESWDFVSRWRTPASGHLTLSWRRYCAK